MPTTEPKNKSLLDELFFTVMMNVFEVFNGIFLFPNRVQVIIRLIIMECSTTFPRKFLSESVDSFQYQILIFRMKPHSRV